MQCPNDFCYYPVYFLGKAENYIRQLLSGTVRYQCKRCLKHYKHKHVLKRHVEFECGKTPQFRCTFCDYKAKRKYELAKHIKAKHNDLDYILQESAK